MNRHALRVILVFVGLVAAAFALHLVVTWLGAPDLIKKLHGH